MSAFNKAVQVVFTASSKRSGTVQTFHFVVNFPKQSVFCERYEMPGCFVVYGIFVFIRKNINFIT